MCPPFFTDKTPISPDSNRDGKFVKGGDSKTIKLKSTLASPLTNLEQRLFLAVGDECQLLLPVLHILYKIRKLFVDS